MKPVSHPPVMNRADVVTHAGELALTHSGVTPLEAQHLDLNFLGDALRQAQIPHLLFRKEDDRVGISVARDNRKAARNALVETCANEPFYAVHAGDSRPTLVADPRGGLDLRGGQVTLYRPRVDTGGTLRYGAETGVLLEVWHYTDATIEAPSRNALMRRSTPRADADIVSTRFAGRDWQTVAGMFDELESDIRFDIDLIFSWVDGAQLEWQRARARRMEAYVVGEGDDAEARYRQLDELKYALRSVYLYAPWVRNIYIVTDSPRPAWLAEHPRVTVLPSEKFFRNPADLPTHNSHAVESQLHHIPGLSEHFLYSNDDMFFGRAVRPQTFFTPGGITKFIEATTRIGLGSNNPARSGFENAARVNRQLLHQRFGKTITRHLEHCAAPLRKSVIEELEAEFPDDFARTSASQFRQATDISVTNSLYHYYAFLTGRAVKQRRARVKYVDTTTHAGLADLASLLAKRSHDMFCLNDGSFPEISAEERAAAMHEFLESYYPIPAPWEVSVAASAGVAVSGDVAVSGEDAAAADDAASGGAAG